MNKLWEKAETNAGIPYYINHLTERTQWDHPEFVKALEMLDDMGNIQLAAYRAAMKLRALQKVLNLDFVDLLAINSAFDQFGFRRSSDNVLDVAQLHSIIYEVFYMTKTRKCSGSSMLDVDTSTDMLLNWVLNLYDMGRTGCLKVLSAKTCMVALCASTITDKYHYLYQQLTDRPGGISRRNMTVFLQDLIRITELVHESAVLGRNAGAAVSSCFATDKQLSLITLMVSRSLRAYSESCITPQIIGTTVSQDRYMSWLMAEPQTIVWLPTMHRLAAAETMNHEAKCNICKTVPIVGLRFKCLKCLNYDMCQDCFFVGVTTKKHKFTHPTQEYVLGTSSKEDIRAFAKTIRNKLSKKHGRRNKLKYLPVDDSDTNTYTCSNSVASKVDMHVRLEHLSKQLAAVEDMKPAQPPSTKVTPSPDSWTRPPEAPSPDSGRASAMSQGTFNDRSRSRERRNLEDLIDMLEKENEALVADIEQLVRMASANDSVADADNDREDDYSGMSGDEEDSDAEEEMMQAKQEVLEEQNRQLEMQLRMLKELLKQNRTLPKASASMYVPRQPEPPHPYHTPPTAGTLDHTAPLRLPSHQAIAQSQRSIDVTNNGHANIFTPATRNNVMLNQSAAGADRLCPPYVVHQSSVSEAVIDSDMPRPPITMSQSAAYESVINSETLRPPVTMDQSAAAHGSYPPDLADHTRSPLLSDSTVPLPPYCYNQSAMTPGTFASRMLLPAHLTDQSTVMFPNLSASRVFPPEEAEMNEILRRLNEANPLNAQDKPSSPEMLPLPSYAPAPTFMRTRRPRGMRDNPQDMIDAVDRIGIAMSTLVARVTDKPSGT